MWSFRPSPFGENDAGVTVTTPSVLVIVNGTSRCTIVPAAVRAVITMV